MLLAAHNLADGELISYLLHKGQKLGGVGRCQTAVCKHVKRPIRDVISVTFDCIAEHMPASGGGKGFLGLWGLTPQVVGPTADVVVNVSVNTVLRSPL